ncbi:hypothetical protein ACTXT7_015369, partial [Hymenolepis weldensis]
MSEDVEDVLISGATLGFLSSSAFSEDFYMQGLLLGKMAANNPRCLEIVAVLPCHLRPGALSNYVSVSDSELQPVGIYKCKKSGNARWKFSINDYKLMSMESIGLFFLIEVQESRSVLQQLFQVRKKITAEDGGNFIRQIGFRIISIETSIGRLYDASKMQVESSVNDLTKKVCLELKNHATAKLMTATEALSNTMENLYKKTGQFVENANKNESEFPKIDYNPNGISNRDNYSGNYIEAKLDKPRFSGGSHKLSVDWSVTGDIPFDDRRKVCENMPGKICDPDLGRTTGNSHHRAALDMFDPIKCQDRGTSALDHSRSRVQSSG